jgi:hypothetical protein
MEQQPPYGHHPTTPVQQQQQQQQYQNPQLVQQHLPTPNGTGALPNHNVSNLAQQQPQKQQPHPPPPPAPHQGHQPMQQNQHHPQHQYPIQQQQMQSGHQQRPHSTLEQGSLPNNAMAAGDSGRHPAGGYSPNPGAFAGKQPEHQHQHQQGSNQAQYQHNRAGEPFNPHKLHHSSSSDPATAVGTHSYPGPADPKHGAAEPQIHQQSREMHSSVTMHVAVQESGGWVGETKSQMMDDADDGWLTLLPSNRNPPRFGAAGPGAPMKRPFSELATYDEREKRAKCR